METEKEELTRRRIMDLAIQSDRRRVYTCTRFLTPMEQSLVYSLKNELPVPVTLIGIVGIAGEGSDPTIRKIAVFGSEEESGFPFENPIRILYIRPKTEKYAELLSHRDCLGALMSLGIKRDLTGDIIVKEKEAWVYVLDSILPFLCESLSQIRHTSVICEAAEGTIPQLIPSFQTLSLNVASERLDLLIAGAAGLNREAAKKLLKEEKVFVNGRNVISAGHRIQCGDELVVRGFGKYIYDGIDSVSRKGRSNVTLRKYV